MAFFFTSSELTTQGTITARSGIVRRSFLAKSTRTVLSSTTTNCSGLVSEPALIWKVGKPPTLTARSSDHLTSFAVTGVPSWNLAFFFSLKVTDMSPTFMSSASSGLNLSRS